MAEKKSVLTRSGAEKLQAELKELLATFQAAQGTFRKMRASSLLR